MVSPDLLDSCQQVGKLGIGMESHLVVFRDTGLAFSCLVFIVISFLSQGLQGMERQYGPLERLGTLSVQCLLSRRLHSFSPVSQTASQGHSQDLLREGTMESLRVGSVISTASYLQHPSQGLAGGKCSEKITMFMLSNTCT